MGHALFSFLSHYFRLRTLTASRRVLSKLHIARARILSTSCNACGSWLENCRRAITGRTSVMYLPRALASLRDASVLQFRKRAHENL